MKILVSSINFAPDHAGIGVYSSDFPVYLAQQGHQVTMVTGFSYYPHWKKRPEDRRRLFGHEFYRGVRVLRGYLYVPSRVSTLNRFFHEATFCLFAAVNFLRAGKPDVIVIFTPPFSLGLVAFIAAKFWRRPFIINVQDLPLDAALALGMVRPSLATHMMFGLESWIYRQADQVVTISESMMENVRAKGVDMAKTKLVPNWVDVEEYSKAVTGGDFIREHPQAAGKLTVAYAGNLGIKQGIDVLIRLAKAMESEERYHFFVIGDGADKSRLLELAQSLQVRNLTFLPFLKPDPYKLMLGEVDVIFVAQRSGAGDNFFPSKLLGLMARQKPLLVAADARSELARAIETGGFGLVSPYEDIVTLGCNLRKYASGEVSILETGRRGLKAAKTFDRRAVLGNWESSIMTLAKVT